MSRPNLVRRAVLAAAGATVLVGLAACSSGSGTPEGWTRVEDGWLIVMRHIRRSSVLRSRGDTTGRAVTG